MASPLDGILSRPYGFCEPCASWMELENGAFVPHSLTVPMSWFEQNPGQDPPACPGSGQPPQGEVVPYKDVYKQKRKTQPAPGL